MSNATEYLLISNKDNINDNYRLSAGLFVSDFAVVSTYAVSCRTFDEGATTTEALDIYYVPIPSTGFEIKYNLEGNTLGGAYPPPFLRYKSKAYACDSDTIGLDTFHSDISSVYYISNTVDSLTSAQTTATSSVPAVSTVLGYSVDICEFTGDIDDTCILDSCYKVASAASIVFDTDVVGGVASTQDDNIAGVKDCLIVPAQDDFNTTKGDMPFNTFTLSGGVEAARLSMHVPPTAILIVTVSSLADLSFVSAAHVFNYYESSATIINVNNEVNNWYVDVSGFMWPTQYLFHEWNARWQAESFQTISEDITAFYLNRSTGAEGSEYNFNVESVDEDPTALNQQIDYVRFKFPLPGRKKIDFLLTDGNSDFDAEEKFFSYSLSTMYFNNSSDIRVDYVSGNYDNSPNDISLSAVSFFGDDERIALDADYPNVKWLWENNAGAQTGLTITSLKNGESIVYNSASAAVDVDHIKISSTVSDFYDISVVNVSSGEVATYTWSYYIPSSVSLEYEYDNCSLSRTLRLSAFTDFKGESILYDGIDKDGNAAPIKWLWDTNNVNAKSDTRNIFNDTIYLAENSNPIEITFNDATSVTQVLCSTNFSVSSNTIDPFDNVATVKVDYDLLPKGFEVDIDANFENATDINDIFYRIVDDTSYSVNLKGKVKPEDATGWLTDDQVSDLQVNNPFKFMWYFNGSSDNVFEYNKSTQATFDLSGQNYHLSSVTFLVSCLSASPNFGYGHTTSKTLQLRVYKDSFVPTLKTAIFPEYQWRLPDTSPVVRPLNDSPNQYWLETPYPSSYGEGKTNLFLASAYSDDHTIVLWENFYDISNWYIGDVVNGGIGNRNTPFRFNVPTQKDTEQSINSVVGAFNSSISLLNQTLSTYKNDENGTEEVYKNWKSIGDPILITNYENPSSQEITFSSEVVDQNQTVLKFNVDLEYPNTSPVKENIQFENIDWTIVSDTNQNFSGASLLGDEYSLIIDPKSNIRTLNVSATITTKQNIPNQLGYNFAYPLKDVTYTLPEQTFDVSFANFSLSSLDAYSVVDNLSDTITAYTDVTLSGNVLTNFDSYDYEWTVDGVALGTNTPFVTTLDGYSNYTSNSGYQGPSIPISLYITDGTLEFVRNKTLHVNPPISLEWRVTPNNSRVKNNQETFFFNDTIAPIALSGFLYNFTDETTVYNAPYQDLLYRTFPSVGDKDLSLTAVDLKGLVHETELNNIIKIVSNYNTYIEDQFTGEAISLKNDLNSIKIKSNEWVSDLSINPSFNKLYDNLTFLENISKFYSKPPQEMQGWLGSYGSEVKWNLNPFDSNYNVVNSESGTLEKLVTFQIVDDDYVLLAYDNKVEIRENKYDTVEVESITQRSVNDNFTGIKNVVVDSEGKIVVLDSKNFGTVSIYEFNPILLNPFKWVVSFGGYGSKTSKSKFNNANDLSINSADELFVTDTGNGTIKKYTNTGGFLGRFDSTKFDAEGDSVISSSCSDSGVVYALTNDYVVLFDNTTRTEMSHFQWKSKVENLTPVRIAASRDENIVYIVGEEKVAKFTKDGLLIGYLGETPEEFSTTITNFKYTNYVHTPNRVGYLVSDSFVLKYADYISYLYIKPLLDPIWWQQSDLVINKNENVDYWVYNKVFNRFWENMELFRESLKSRVLFTFDENGKLIFKLYKRDERYKPAFTYSKEDILIGVNEIVSSEVLNRCLSRLTKCQEELLDMITSQTVRYRWVDTIQSGNTPTTWKSTKSGDINPLKWGEAIN